MFFKIKHKTKMLSTIVNYHDHSYTDHQLCLYIEGHYVSVTVLFLAHDFKIRVRIRSLKSNDKYGLKENMFLLSQIFKNLCRGAVCHFCFIEGKVGLLSCLLKSIS